MLPRRILVPVDFEHASRRALRYARALAAASGAEVELVHVIPGPAGQIGDEYWINLARKTLTGLAERARFAPGTRTEVLSGPVAPAISQYACDQGCDLMILSGRRVPDWQGSLLGSTAAAILRHARIPVLIVPAAGAVRAAERRTA
jgi:nucleotide-binding universal stress UspA family protein